MDVDALLAVLNAASEAVASALSRLDDWSLAGTREGQYRSDLAADSVALELLLGAGLAVLSEESGVHEPDRPLLAVVDPVDGSTNASRGLPWYATSVCVLDAEGPLVALVVNQATGARYEAVRDRGARRDGRAIEPSGASELRRSIIGLSGYPSRHLGWRQYRSLGAVALDLCAVAEGALDGFVDCVDEAHGGPWDYLGGLLVCQEAGAVAADAIDRDLVVRDAAEWRSPVAAATPALLDQLLAERSAAARPASR
ncbi:MAG: inositol monophosphatase/fructose,6-bisphosphatase family protein [Acidimicrobiaceae bacterium]|nr:inositol monophosphatase/fructose,6-bisphosphatase family protein [Acidimicrobiaceae bacterium]